MTVARALGVAATLAACGALAAPPYLDLPTYRLTANELGVIIDTANPLSVAVGEYYAARHKIPAENVVRVALPGRGSGLPGGLFRAGVGPA